MQVLSSSGTLYLWWQQAKPLSIFASACTAKLAPRSCLHVSAAYGGLPFAELHLPMFCRAVYELTAMVCHVMDTDATGAHEEKPEGHLVAHVKVGQVAAVLLKMLYPKHFASTTGPTLLAGEVIGVLNCTWTRS